MKTYCIRTKLFEKKGVNYGDKCILYGGYINFILFKLPEELLTLHPEWFEEIRINESDHERIIITLSEECKAGYNDVIYTKETPDIDKIIIPKAYLPSGFSSDLYVKVVKNNRGYYTEIFNIVVNLSKGMVLIGVKYNDSKETLKESINKLKTQINECIEEIKKHKSLLGEENESKYHKEDMIEWSNIINRL